MNKHKKEVNRSYYRKKVVEVISFQHICTRISNVAGNGLQTQSQNLFKVYLSI